MSGGAVGEPGDGDRRLVFEIDRTRSEIGISLVFGSWKHRLELGAFIAFCIVMMLFSGRSPIPYAIGVVPLLLIDAYYSFRLLAMRRLGADAFYIDRGVLVRHRPPRRVLRIPLDELDGVGVQRLLGGRRIVVLLRGGRVYGCPDTVERADVVARRIMEEAGLPRVAKFDRLLPVSRTTLAELVMGGLFIIALVALYQTFDRLGWFVIPIVTTFAVGCVVVAIKLRRDPRADIWYCCRNCLYDLRGITDDRCPECGEYQ